MANPVESVRLAMNAVAEAQPTERRQRMVALYAAAVQLRDWTVRKHDRLMAQDAWLTANQSTEPEFFVKEEKYLHGIMAYQEAMDVLSAAYELVRDESRSVSVPRPAVKQGVWRQLGEAPF